jgi:glycosyltransferase involved in cell wall biosynthesis
MHSISIIIPSFNSIDTIEFTLKHIEELQDYNSVIEVIVVDSSDDNKTKAFLDGYTNKKLRVITSGIRVMPAIQRNIGAREAKGDILAFIDSDAYPDKEWIRKILAVFKENIKLGGGSYLLPEFQHTNKIAVAQYYLQFNEFIPAGKQRIKNFFPSCNIFCDKDFFMDVGGFPEVRASEDTLFCLKAGEKTDLLFVPEATVYHIFRTKKEAFHRNQLLLGKFVLIYRRDYYKSIIYKGIFPIVTAPVIACIKLFRITSRIRIAGKFHRKMFRKSLFTFLIGLFFWTKGYISAVLVKNR